jgi:hypothetical protein
MQTKNPIGKSLRLQLKVQGITTGRLLRAGLQIHEPDASFIAGQEVRVPRAPEKLARTNSPGFCRFSVELPDPGDSGECPSVFDSTG